MYLDVDLIIKYLLKDDGYFGVVVDSFNKCTQFLGSSKRVIGKEQFLQLKGGAYHQLVGLTGLLFAFFSKENAQFAQRLADRQAERGVAALPPSASPASLTPFANFLLTEKLTGDSQVWSNITGEEALGRLQVLWSDQYPLQAFNASRPAITNPRPTPSYTPIPRPIPASSLLTNSSSFLNEFYKALFKVDFKAPPKNGGTLWTEHRGVLHGNLARVQDAKSTTLGLLGYLYEKNLYLSTEPSPLSLGRMDVGSYFFPKTFYIYPMTYKVAQNFEDVIPYADNFLKAIAASKPLQGILGISNSPSPVAPTQNNTVVLEDVGSAYRDLPIDRPLLNITNSSSGSSSTAVAVIPTPSSPNYFIIIVGVLTALFSYLAAVKAVRFLRPTPTSSDSSVTDLCRLPLEERAKYYN